MVAWRNGTGPRPAPRGREIPKHAREVLPRAQTLRRPHNTPSRDNAKRPAEPRTPDVSNVVPMRSQPADASRSRIVAVVSDIHFKSHCLKSWGAFRQWHADVQPDETIILGDFVDFETLGRYLKSPDCQIHAIEEIRAFVHEANILALECGTLTIVEGNHDGRWEKAIFGELAPAFRDALGLTLRDQALAHGLTRHAKWVRESNQTPCVKVGQFDLSHGHNAAGRFGGGKHLAANAITKTMGRSTVRGHHHRAQMFCQTHGDATAIAIANPCLTVDHSYAISPDWQRGFTILELDAPDYTRATPHVIVMENGRFSYGGKTYGALQMAA